MLIINQPETEENWDRMERAFLILASVVRGGAYKLDADFVPGVRTIARSSTNAVSLLCGRTVWKFLFIRSKDALGSFSFVRSSS
jgi:hypothetical protein